MKSTNREPRCQAQTPLRSSDWRSLNASSLALPFRYRTILISPNRVLPIVPFRRCLTHGFFINLDPKARSFQIAAAIEMEWRAKQELLVLRSARQRLDALEKILRAAIVELGPRAEIHIRARRNGKGGSHAAIVQRTQDP